MRFVCEYDVAAAIHELHVGKRQLDRQLARIAERPHLQPFELPTRAEQDGLAFDEHHVAVSQQRASHRVGQQDPRAVEDRFAERDRDIGRVHRIAHARVEPLRDDLLRRLERHRRSAPLIDEARDERGEDDVGCRDQSETDRPVRAPGRNETFAAQREQAPVSVRERFRNEPAGIAGGSGGNALVWQPPAIERGAKPWHMTPCPSAAADRIDDDEPAVGVDHRRHDA